MLAHSVMQPFASSSEQKPLGGVLVLNTDQHARLKGGIELKPPYNLNKTPARNSQGRRGVWVGGGPGRPPKGAGQAAKAIAGADDHSQWVSFNDLPADPLRSYFRYRDSTIHSLIQL